MTLAVVFLINILWAAAPVPATLNDQSAPPAASAPATQDQTTPATGVKQSTAAPSSAKPTASRVHTPAKKPVNKKKVQTAGCDSATAKPAQTASDSASVSQSGNASGGTRSAHASRTSAAPKNCPPAKIIVPHGGTAEQSIQLEGEPSSGEISQDREATKQMLEMTETNLKKMAEQQLSASQQDSVTQIREFVEQSKTALVAGDMERARTLAWKAKLLSDDLAKPQK
jgi:hypothetical protein